MHISGGKAMGTSRTDFDEEESWGEDRPNRGAQPIGEILEELLVQYQTRFPQLNISLVETAATPA
jgi:hypothetical protein